MKNEDKIILHLCAEDGSDSKYYAEAGYDVKLITKEIGVEKFNPPENVYGIIANPPCTHFSVARTSAKTERDLNEGLRLVKECLRIIWKCNINQFNESSRKMPLKFWMIENPATGFLKWFLGKPVYKYCPSEFGASFKKQTALWGIFNNPVKPILYNPLPSKRGLVGRLTSEGNKKRSECYPAFAKAFFYANQ